MLAYNHSSEMINGDGLTPDSEFSDVMIWREKIMRLKGKVAIIAGAGFGRGMSRGFPEGFAREGADLSLNIRRNEPERIKELVEELESFGSRVIVTVGDISEEAVAKKLVENTIEAFGRVDILLNNTGMTNPKPITEMTVEEWDRMIAVNLRSHFLTCKYTIPHMIAQKSGRIINIASQVAQKGGTDHCHYAASKAGIIGMTKALAWDLGKYGITCNCIAPGPIDTQMMDSVSEEWRAAKLNDLVLPRFGTIDEVVPSAIFLASEPDGNIYTGQTLGPNSGDVML
ncbi:MAG: 3-oxoacyl-ACP reductase FabG [Paenibacillus sp.]|uniref:SDR family NAD(P)-dependent oxidoreductase n=1 Tax=Paenibacillus sp. TaxID=58172 RepID=UPI0025E0F212|nr:3-oxoacyl-ACP reductase family protein [Paenibacillus sp.]MBR2565007.1 3-oxoacyl-ACP reductase FabG [Paenibacillus sp.]